MADDPGLTADHHPAADLGAAADAGLCGDHGMMADVHVVGDLDEVIELCARPDHRRSDGGPVDGDIGSYLHIIFDLHISYLRHLFEGTIGLWRKAKTVAADDRPGMNGHVRADNAVVVDLNTRMEDGMVADADVVADINLGMDLNVIADDDAFAEISKSTYKNVFADFGGRGAVGWFLDARELLRFDLLVLGQQAGKGAIGIGDTRISVARTGCFSSNVSLTMITLAPVV